VARASRLDIAITAQNLLAHPTVEKLAKIAQKTETTSIAPPSGTIQRVKREGFRVDRAKLIS
jgi:hypothetical protein